MNLLTFYVIVIYLATLTNEATYTFDNITITLNTISSAPIWNDGTDRCGMIRAGNNQVYHASSGPITVLERLGKGNFNNYSILTRADGPAMAFAVS